LPGGADNSEPIADRGPRSRLLFAHDHRFFHGFGEERYSSGSFPSSLWDRYLEHFDDVIVVARSAGVAPSPSLTRADRAHVQFELLPNLSSLKQILLPSPTIDARIRSLVQSADAVVARLPSEIGLLAVRHARRLGKPYAVEVVGCVWDSMLSHGALRGRIYAPLGFYRNRRAIRNAPFVLYVTSSWLQQRYPTRGHAESASNVELLPIGIGASARERRQAAIAGGALPVLGTIGTLWSKYKGIETAFDALARLRSSGLELSYRILGPGPADHWRRLSVQFGVSDLVHFDGVRSAGEGVANWLDDIDLYLQPSLTEGLPRGMIEAMSRGAVCIGSTRGGIPELLPPERLHRPWDAAALSEMIRRYATDAVALAAASRVDLETSFRFDPGVLKQRRHALYARLARQAEHSRRHSSDSSESSL
jgi:glycosyltransferase involved in cell wall biosynthesis